MAICRAISYVFFIFSILIIYRSSIYNMVIIDAQTSIEMISMTAISASISFTMTKISSALPNNKSAAARSFSMMSYFIKRHQLVCETVRNFCHAVEESMPPPADKYVIFRLSLPSIMDRNISSALIVVCVSKCLDRLILLIDHNYQYDDTYDNYSPYFAHIVVRFLPP